jgi:hypothetical protein
LSVIEKILLMAAVFLMPASMGQASWTSTDELSATAHGGEGMGMFSDIHKTVDSVVGHKEFISHLNASNVDDVTFTSSSYLTMLDDNGETNTTGSIISESLDLPDAFSISMAHHQGIDKFYDPKNMTQDNFTTLTITPLHTGDGQEQSGLESSLGMATSALDPSQNQSDDSFSIDTAENGLLSGGIDEWINNPDMVGNIVDDSVSDLGQGVTLDKLKNLKHEITYDHPHFSTKNGESCYWGESKNKMIRLI